MPDLEAVRHRIVEHPAFHGGPADETYILDWLEWNLSSEGFTSDKLDEVADRIASIQEGNPQRWLHYVAHSHTDLLAKKIVQALIRRLRMRGVGVPSDAPDAVTAEGMNTLCRWALAVATGDRPEPPAPRGRPKEPVRSAVIAWAVSAIRDLGELPYEGMDGSACQAVAGRLNMSHAAVRSIWRKEQPQLRRWRENGLLPPAKKQTRRQTRR